MNQVAAHAHRAGSALFRPVDLASLAVFRIAFGLLMLHHVWVEYTGYGGFQHWFVDPAFHFTYFGFAWVRPLPETVLHLVYAAQALACAGILLGAAYRLAAVINFLATTYFFLLEKTLFINHGYLLCLISFLLIFLPLHAQWSIDARRRPGLRAHQAPAWCLYLLRFQVGIVYFYGGLAKLNPDWLRGEPMRSYLADWAGRPLVGALAHSETAVWFFSGGGLVLDLFVVPALLWRPTRIPAFLAAAAFHLTNAWLFNIAIFPWFMIVATTLFFAPDWPRRVWARVRPAFGTATRTVEVSPTPRPLLVALIGCWVLVQVLVPFRHLLYPGDASWTEEGHHFAWRMMLRHKSVQPRFLWYTMHDPATGRSHTIDPYAYLPADEAAALRTDPAAMEAFARQIQAINAANGVPDVSVQAELRLIQFRIHDPVTGETRHEDLHQTLQPWQIEIMAVDPDLILQFAHHLAQREARARGHAVAVYAEVWASLHGRPYQPLVAPDANLADAPRNLWPKPWVVPLIVAHGNIPTASHAPTKSATKQQ